MNKQNNLRRLTPEEIRNLEAQACTCDQWSEVLVKDGFSTRHIRHVRFSGHIRLGRFDSEFVLEGGIKRHSGIFHAFLHNCTVGDGVYIGDIHRFIANYTIGDNSYIENIEELVTTGPSCFGNGTEVAVLNETGGREIKIFDQLSSHVAYILALYRHRAKTIDRINYLIDRYCERLRSETGSIGHDVKIVNCGTLKDVKIGDFTCIEGANLLVNGSINSNESDPIYIGEGVIAKNFIFSSGSQITDASLVENCFIGQGTQIGKHFSIYDSLYFCNCQGFHGEACAIFGGPYTVTHHKSSLLIAGMFSFLNAGSGSNQSNHMYKLGPIHQGIVERGSKTTSDSYILWPAKVGPFSLVMGRHHHHSDTSNLPFSYLIENNDATYIVPGINLRSVGTIRDAQKWPKRDRRKDPNKLDAINFNLLSPFTIQKMYAGTEILETLKSLSGGAADTYAYQHAIIKNSALQKGLDFYRMAINKFLGNSIIKRLEITQFKSIDEIRNRLKPETSIGLGDWVDLSGLIAPKSEINRILNDVESGKTDDILELNRQMQQLHTRYYEYEWTWALQKLEEKLHKSYTQFTVADITSIVETWTESVVTLDNFLYEDAKKEFTMTSKTGFGIDGDDEVKNADFAQVRGEFDNNPFVREVQQHIRIKTELGKELIGRIGNIS